MAIRRSQKLLKSRKQRRNASLKAQRHTERGLRFESLEDRRLLAFGPQLQGVLPDAGSLLTQGDVRDVAPRELLFVFDETQMLDASTLSGAFELTRSGLDGVFGDSNDVVITPGFIGLGETSSEVVMRFATRLVDDQYRLLIKGTGADALRNQQGYALNDTDGDGAGADDTLDFELDLGAQIIAVVPQPVAIGGPVLTQARNQIVVYFNDDDLFVENDGSGAPTARSAENPDFYQLILTRDTVTNTDDDVFKPTDVSYDPQTDRAVLTFDAPLDELAGPGTFRLRIGTDESKPPVPVVFDLGGVEPGSSFGTAVDISADFDGGNTSSIVISQEIVSTFVPLSFPGAMDEPGMRNIPVQGPYLPDPDVYGATIFDLVGNVQDDLGITTAYYNFRDFYGFDPEGNALNNQITENQKQRTREIFELYGSLLGIDFIESADLGMTIVTGDMRAINPLVPTGPGGVLGLAEASVATGLGLNGRAIMDAGEVNWTDRYGGNWFQTAMHEIGHLLGLGHTDELAPITVLDDEPILAFDNIMEPDFPGDYDIMHGQYRWRPENNDIDLYTFQVNATGLFTAETLAERLPNASLLDTNLRLYKQTPTGVPILLSHNDDYFSQDSYIQLELEPGTYFVGVAASGNDQYDPTIEDSGIGGTSAGIYDLRLTFRPGAVRSIVDNDNSTVAGTPLDGDLDGVPGGVYDFWFRAAAPKGETANPTDPRTIFVDKGDTGIGTGTLAQPYGDLPTAISNARAGDIVRVVGNGGLDDDITTVDDNFAYEIGFGTLQNNTLSDGSALVVPKQVTLMVDEGAIFKLRNARISVGSTTLSNAVDVSAGAIQLLGTPDLDVIMTSYLNEDIGFDTNPHVTIPKPGDWGGILIRQDLDRSENRFLWDNEGIFLNYVNHTDFTYGGGSVKIDGVNQVVNPVSMVEARPTISFNTISLSADAALSADPNSFRESNFHSPLHQKNTPFTSDYSRVGPDIDWNTTVDNSINGLFVRVQTLSGSTLKPQTVAGRWDDTDIVHVLTQTLKLQGTPGGLINEQDLPPSNLVTLTPQTGGQLQVGHYNYRLVFVDANDNESLPSTPTESVEIVADGGRLLLRQLPPAPAGFVARRLYRSDATGNPNGEYRLIATLDASDTTYVDMGLPGGGLLDLSTAPNTLNRARLDASLAIDPGTIVKLEGSRIEVEMGAQLLAEGLDGQRVIFTSRLDDRFGGSGTFDTNNDADTHAPQAGNWSGIFAGPESTVSFDHSLFTYGGGISPVEGSFTGFNVLEIHQATARVTNSIFEYNAVGTGGAAPTHRFGRGFNEAATIFVRAAQPVIVNNIVRRGNGPALSVNANALNSDLVRDLGRMTGLADIATTVIDNQGPLIKDNNVESNSINGLVVRGETMTTQGVWDDTDIVHVLFDTVYVSDFHIYGGLRLESKPAENLVVKLSGTGAGFTATGRPLDIDDRIGGVLQIVGQPGSPVVLTSLRDDTQGAGFRASDGQPQTDTNGDGNATAPAPGDWDRILLDAFSHDRNVEIVVEREPTGLAGPGTNATPNTSETLGELAQNEKDSDENLRLGFEVHGTLNSPTDRDVYSIAARAGTEVWIDIDRTEHALDTVVELIGSDGTVIARSDNSFAESNLTELIFAQPLVQANALQKSPYLLGKDAYTTNPRDAGLRLVLPGTVGSDPSLYYVRVRSSSPDLANLEGGLTSGQYQLQVRLRETDEVPGSTIRYADIRYATTGVEIAGQVIHSPLLGEASEGNNGGNDTITGAELLGNLLNTDRAALSIGGTLNGDNDVDFYRFEIAYDSVQGAGIYNPYLYLSTIFDLDYADQFGRADASLYVFDEDFNLVLSSSGVSGSSNGNIAEDQPRPLAGADVADLSRGSAGTLDPYIGTQSLPQGVYYLAVTNANRLPQELEQYVTANPSNPLIRLEPINSIVRIAEDRIGGSGGSRIATGPIVPELVNTNEGVVPFTLGDVTLFISVDGGLSPGYVSHVRTVDPFTGTQETALGNVSGAQAPYIGDIAMRYDGELFSFSQSYLNVPRDDASVGNVLNIDTGTADYTSPGDDGIQTYIPDANGAPVRPNNGAGVGVSFEAITFAGDQQYDLYAVGNRGDAPNAPVEFDTNILYRFETANGVANSIPSPNNDRTGCPPGGNECQYVGAGTQIRERGQIITQSGEIITVDATDPADPWDPNYSIQSGNRLTVSDQFETRTYVFETGPEVEVNVDQVLGQVIRDGQFMTLDGDFFQFDTGYSLVIPADTFTTPAGGLIADGLILSLTDTQGVPFTVEFNDVTTGGDGIVAQFAIDYTVDMTQVELQQQIINAINGIPFDIIASPIGTAPGLVTVAFENESSVDLFGQIQVDTQTSPLTTLLQTLRPQVAEETILIPGTGYVDGQTFSISDGQTTLLFEMEDLQNPNGVTPGSILIGFDGASPPQDIAVQILQAFIDNDVRLMPTLDTGTFPGQAALHIQTAIGLSGELSDAPIVEVPRGAVIADGNQFSITTVDGTVVFEFDNLSGFAAGVTPGNVPVYYSPFNTPVVMAAIVADAVNAYTSVEATVTNQYVVMNGQQRPLGHTGPAPITPHVTFVNVNSPLAVRNLWDYESNNADPPTFNDIDGFLRGFEETQTMAQVQTQLAAELNVTRLIGDATNGAFANIEITDQADHIFGVKTGDSVIIRGVNGQIYANGLFDITIVDNNSFTLNGTAFRDNSGQARFNYVDGGVYLNYEASSAGVRTNFLGAKAGMFDGVPIFADQGTVGGGAFNTTRLPLLAADTAADVANTLAYFINREFFPNGTANSVLNTVSLNNIVVRDIDPPLTSTSTGAGGLVTGIAIVNGIMYAVDDNGGLYSVANYQGSGGLRTTQIADLGVEFAGLSHGPTQAEGGIYGDLLFGITTGGRILAFDTSGIPQAVFVDGRTSVETGVSGVNGMAFSTLDVNLWHVTSDRGNDAGHGIQVPVDNSRLPSPGGSSFYFGFQNPGANGWSGIDPGNRSNYDFPGGAHGTLITNPFSLSGYSAADDPVLYFNYFLETEGAMYDPTTNPPTYMRDSFRVYIADEAGAWQLLATNDSFRHETYTDEFELGDGAIPSFEDEVYGRRGIQELYDNSGSWRQARIQLAPWAGQEDLILKFEFASAGDVDLGGTAGVQLTGVAASEFVDGDFFWVDNPAFNGVRFEFDLGHELDAQAAGSITAGSQFIVDGETYEFYFGGPPPAAVTPILLDPLDDALTVANKVRSALLANGNVVQMIGNRINLPALPNLGDVQVLGSGLLHTGLPGVAATSHPIPMTLAQTSVQVAAAVRQALEDEYAGGDADGYQSVKIHRDMVTLVGHTVTNAGPLQIASSQIWDDFGAFNVSGPPQTTRYPGSQRGMDNAHEGVYIDDLIIGFAERGELITNATGNAAYRDNPYVPDFSTLLGTYQVEVRRGPEYGLAGIIFGLDPGPPPFGDGGRAFDTNDRLTQAVSLVAPAADQVYDGQQFHISDGINTVIFEFDDVDLGNGSTVGDGVTSGAVAVPYNPTKSIASGLGAETSWEMARKIRDLINSSQVQAVIQVSAALSDGAASGANSTSDVINLFGDATGSLYPTFDQVFPTFDFGEIEVITYGYSQRLLATEPTPEHTMVGDENLFRDQGQILIHSNLIRDSLQYGIIADAGARSRTDLVPDAGALPHAGPVRNLRIQNLDRLVPGPVLQNNVISGSGTAGILVSGDPNSGTGELASVAFSRVVNNTISGTGGGVGISVTQNAAPTILNTIIANVGTGLSIDGSSSPNTELGGMLFQNVGTLSSNGQLGAYPIVLGPTDPLFVDAANDNFQLAAFSSAIDSSVDSLEDRQDLVFVKDPLEISQSPILAPELDVYGQKRVDDTSVNTPSGQGDNVFKDRGAIDRVDFTGLVAILANPLDNDARDASDSFTFVATEETLGNFSILLTDAGTGADDTTVSRNNVTLLADGKTLVAGVDYSFAYDPTSNTIRLSPIAGIWPEDRQYDIDLANRARTVISFATSTPADETLLTITDRENPANVVEFEYDTGFVLIVPVNGGADLADGETFTLTHGSKTVMFEFDNNNKYSPGNARIPFLATSTRTAVANALVTAIKSRFSALNPVNVGGGQVHIGGDDTTQLVTANSALGQAGQPGLNSTTALPIVIMPRMYVEAAAKTAAAMAASDLVGVNAEAFGSEVFVTEAASVVGSQLTIKQVTPIRDLAGNLLQANRADSTTRFTILTGLGVDYGDAPSQYPVLKADNGASHQIVQDYHLGPTEQPSGDGLPSPNADADLGDDGVLFSVLSAGSDNTLTVYATGITAERPGFLDAWIDFNNDGDWTDLGEKILSSEPLVEGANPFELNLDNGNRIPVSAAGIRFARFRFSSTGGLASTGAAADGEVEDYKLTILANPWHNYSNPLSTNGDPYVSPIDVLYVINLLNHLADYGIPDGRLPNPPLPDFAPPPYFDVNGDGYVSPIDALLIITDLNSGSGESGAEGEAGGYGVAVNSSSDPLVGSGLDTGLLAGSLLVAPTVAAPGTTSAPTTSLLATASPVVSPLPTGSADTMSAAQLRSQILGSNFRSEDLEDLLEDMAEDVDELLAVGDARDDFFAGYNI